jgi:hypothetical protein
MKQGRLKPESGLTKIFFFPPAEVWGYKVVKFYAVILCDLLLPYVIYKNASPDLLSQMNPVNFL